MAVLTLQEIDRKKHQIAEIRGITNRAVILIGEATAKLLELENEILDLALQDQP